MATRAASASISSKAKQRIVQLLFGPQYSGHGRQGHIRLDHASYSYNELRSEYLKQIQAIHPDKHAHMKTSSEERRRAHDSNDKFVELQNAWNEYEQVAKMLRRALMRRGEEGSGGESAVQTDFTMFGVGCSFADSPTERKRREEIMDQAGRGWFASGLIPESLSESSAYTIGRPAVAGLADEDMFVMSESCEGANTNLKRVPKKKSLVDRTAIQRKRS